ncbi:hypothetical protein RclHR1_03560001 [Rhizophagus clarus]|uniref:Uncharacterized protein n=1 Tax=Rhizophagus clarus TaxID=94130 RepID=A0A2Z6S5Q4_9GLOM|nr:hypothetical protein RclHR1_03560001 [Rhizophagus clarus]GET01460.1 hypothetical protein GLOIN_2v1672524 [Rhizophagus clarus]
MVSPDELAAQATCYGLPYGIFGIFCWCFTLFSASLVHANCPIFAPWRWSDWIMLLVALGQLTPWSFKIMNDGFKSRKHDSEKSKLGESYRMAGLILIVPLSLVGWIGMTALSISLMKTEKAVSVWIWTLYLIALIAIILALCIENTTFRLSMTYIFSTLHIIGSHVIFALVSNHWSGLAPTGAGMASSVIFFLGKRLLFIDTKN